MTEGTFTRLPSTEREFQIYAALGGGLASGAFTRLPSTEREWLTYTAAGGELSEGTFTRLPSVQREFLLYEALGGELGYAEFSRRGSVEREWLIYQALGGEIGLAEFSRFPGTRREFEIFTLASLPAVPGMDRIIQSGGSFEDSNAIRRFFRRLESSGVMTKIDALWLPGVAHVRDASNYVSKIFDLSPSKAPATRTGLEFLGDAGSNYNVYVNMGARGRIGDDPFTLIVAFKAPSPTSARHFVNIATSTGTLAAGANQVRLLLHTNRRLQIQLADNGGNSTSYTTPNNTIHSDIPTVVGVVRDGSTMTLRIWDAVDGFREVVASEDANWGGFVDASVLRVMRRFQSTSAAVDVTIYDVQLHNYALSPSEIENLIAGGLTDVGQVRGAQDIITGNAINATTENAWESFSNNTRTGFVASNAAAKPNRAGWTIPSEFLIAGRRYRYRHTQDVVGGVTTVGMPYVGNGFTGGTGVNFWAGAESGTHTGEVVCPALSGTESRLRISGTQLSLTVSDAKLDILGCVLHWRFQDGTGTTVTDSSGNGFHGTISDSGGTVTWVTEEQPFPAYYDVWQESGALQQQFTGATVDDIPYLQFSVSRGGYTSAAIPEAAQPHTFFAVLNRASGGGESRVAISTNAPTSPTAWGPSAGFNSSATQTLFLRSANDAVTHTTGTTPFMVVTFHFHGANSVIRRGGVEVASGNGGANGSTGRYYVGQTFNSTAVLNGPLAALIAVRQALTDDERNTIEQALIELFPSTT